MPKAVTITGQKEIIANLKRHQLQLGLRVAAGLIKAGEALQDESQRLVPVDTGNLKASAFTRATGQGLNTFVTVGYLAPYALEVHERVQMKLRGKVRPPTPFKQFHGRFWDPIPRAQAKFLEESSRRMKPQLVAIVKKYAKI